MAVAPSFVRGALLAALLGNTAHADIFKLFAEAHVGGTGGSGLSGDQKEDAFFARSAPPTYGILVGGRFLIIDAFVQHHQFVRLGGGGDAESDLSTWTEFDIGLGFSVDFSAGGDEPKRKGNKGEKAPAPQKRGAFLEVGAHVGFGVGTGEQVDPPLSNDEITDKGFIVEGRLGFGTHLNNVLDAGVQIPVSWGYFFKSGEGAAANDLDTHYQGVQGAALIYLRANLKLL